MAKENRKKKSPAARQPSVAPAWPKHWAAALVLIAASTTAALVHVHGMLAEVHLGYQISKAIHEHKCLLADSRKLQVEVATLRNPRRVRAIAIESLGLIEPLAQQLVWGDRESRGKLALGRAPAASERQTHGKVD